jgi:hypothetical protein
MGLIQIEMRRERIPNPNPKDAGVLPRLYGRICRRRRRRTPGRAPGHRASTAACRVVDVSALVATLGHCREPARRRRTYLQVNVTRRRAS